MPEETHGHINSAFCDGMVTTITAARHFIWRYLYTSMQAAKTSASKLRFVTPDQERSMNTLWQEEEFERRITDCTHKQQYEAMYQSMGKVLQQNTGTDDRKILKSCVQARTEQDNINHPAHGF